MIERVLFIGRGAVGLTLGRILYHALPQGQFAFAADGARACRYASTPVLVNGVEELYPIVTLQDDFQADLIVICTKFGALDQALELARPFVKEDTIFMSGINGVVSEDVIEKAYPDNITLRTIAQKMDSVYENDTLRFESNGELVFGPVSKAQQPAADAVKALFDACQFPYIYSSHIMEDQYSKLMANCGLNQICGVYGLTYGTLRDSKEYFSLFESVMRECMRVFETRGVHLEEAQLQDWLSATKTFAYEGMPSLAQDIRAGRPTEKELFAGTIVQWANEAGIEAPLNARLYQQLDELEKQNASRKESLA